MTNKGIRPGIPTGARPVRTGGPSPFVQEQIAARKLAATQEQEPEPEVKVATKAPEPLPLPKVEEKAAAVAAPKAVEEHAPEVPEGEESQFERVDLMSGYAFYDYQELSMKKFDVFDQAKVARACKYRNWTLLIDAVQATCNRDARDLAVSDFFSLLIWHKHNSYLSGRSRISYVSMYGNKVISATPIAIKIVENRLAKTRADYVAAKEQGFAIATMRDLETISSNELNEDMMYLFDKAQYMSLAGLEEEIAALSAKGDRIPSITARINELARRQKKQGLSAVFDAVEKFEADFADFGSEEVAVVKDSAFDPKLGLEYINRALDESTPDMPRFAEFSAERDRLKEALARGDSKIEAKTEEVPLTFDQWTMFSYT